MALAIGGQRALAAALIGTVLALMATGCASPAQPAGAPAVKPTSAPSPQAATSPGTGRAGPSRKGAAPAETVVVTPAAGRPSTTFRFEGSGFAPDTRIQIQFTAPSGETWDLENDDGTLDWPVDQNGSFSVRLVPARTFGNVETGTWTGAFCIGDTPNCWELQFEIRA